MLDHLSNKLFAPERLGVLLEGFLADQKDGVQPGDARSSGKPVMHVAVWMRPWAACWRWWSPVPRNRTIRLFATASSPCACNRPSWAAT